MFYQGREYHMTKDNDANIRHLISTPCHYRVPCLASLFPPDDELCEVQPTANMATTHAMFEVQEYSLLCKAHAI